MVKKIIAKPQLFFFGLTFAFLILGFINRHEELPINVGDIYYVLSLDIWFYLSAVFYTLIGFNYVILVWSEKQPKKWLSILHMILQIGSLVLLMTKNNWSWLGKQYPIALNILNDNSETVAFIATLLFFTSIFVHLINFFTTLFLKKN